jgi:hypothetical protein
MTLDEEMERGLWPWPNGTILALEDPYKKTVKFMRETDEGSVPCDPPEKYQLRDGWKIVT